MDEDVAIIGDCKCVAMDTKLKKNMKIIISMSLLKILSEHTLCFKGMLVTT